MKIIFPLFALVAMALVSGCNPPVKSTPSADFIISGIGSNENSIATMPPAANTNHGGTIALNRGVVWHTKSGFCIFKNIYANGTIDNTNAIVAGFTANSTPGEINEAKDSLSSSKDNQMVRLDDGSLLLEKNCFFWKKNPKINWNLPEDYKQKGDRSVAAFWRSADSGKSWRLFSWLDPVDFENGKFARPANPPDTGYFHHGGSTRPELYFCPFKKRLYTTTELIGGVSGSISLNNDSTFLFFSNDHGKTWNEAGNLKDCTPDVMTSTGDGKLFTLSSCKTDVELHFTKEVNGKPVLLGPFKVGYAVNGKIIPSEVKIKPANITGSYKFLSLSRVTTDPTQVYDVVRASYPVTDADSTQKYAIMDIFVNKETDEIFTVPLLILQAADPVHYHVSYGTFIEPDFMDIPIASQENTSVFYWIEQSVKGYSGGVHVMAKYCVFTDGLDYTAPQYLSLDASNQPRNWTSANGEGDYLKGGFFWYNNTMNYLCDWNEENGIHGNLITIQPDSTNLKYVKSNINVNTYPTINWNDFKAKKAR